MVYGKYILLNDSPTCCEKHENVCSNFCAFLCIYVPSYVYPLKVYMHHVKVAANI